MAEVAAAVEAVAVLEVEAEVEVAVLPRRRLRLLLRLPRRRLPLRVAVEVVEEAAVAALVPGVARRAVVLRAVLRRPRR